MTTHRPWTAAIAAIFILPGACAKMPGAQQGVPPTYQVVVVPGSETLNVDVFRLNVTTGQTYASKVSANEMYPVPDTPIPSGKYQLYAWSQPARQDGSVTWGVERADMVSGRIWMLNGCGSSPCTWIELTPR